jgi:tetratricopeptide (TPR) repeat protein
MQRKVRMAGGLIAAMTFCFAFASVASLAFSHVAEGDPLPQMQLAAPGGVMHSYLGADTDSVRVFAFVKGGHERSTELLEHLNALREEFSGRAVSWALIVSDRHGSAWADSVASLAPDLLLLVDHQDKLYGTLGVALSPSVGVGTGDGLLHAYLPYRKIHYQKIIGAHISYVLKDMSSDELAQVMNPSGQARDTAEMAAARRLKLARMLLDRNNLEKALIQTEDVLAEFPDSADAYDLLAEIHEAAGRTEQAEAVRLRAEALRKQD